MFKRPSPGFHPWRALRFRHYVEAMEHKGWLDDVLFRRDWDGLTD